MSSRDPAPGHLGVVQAFVNTADLEEDTDALTTPSTLRAWFAERQLVAPSARCTPVDLRRAIEVREALRDLLQRNAGEDAAREPSPVLEAAAARARFTLRFDDTSAPLVPVAGGVDGALGRLLAIVHAAMADGTWRRLKACQAESCRWAFYDHSRNASGSWCDMAVCGSREKMRAYRQRQRAGSRR